MKELREGRFENIKFNEVAFPRYIKVKESIEDLMKILDFEKVKTDGVDRVLSAFLQLIDENDDKTVEEKRAVIEDAIYNGNIFKHYFSDENQSKAIEVLSNTAILNDEERLLYIVNFYMPNDINFTSVYNGFKKDLEKISEYYGLTDEEADRLIYARATEISKFYDMYKSEKDRQNRFNETYVLAAVQEAIDEPNAENIDKAKELIFGLNNLDLKSTLEQQLSELENMNHVESPIEESVQIEEVTAEENIEMKEVESNLEETVETQENTETEVEDVSVTSEDVLAEELVTTDDLKVEEPKALEEVLEEPITLKSLPNQEGVKQEVMVSLQNLVATAKENASKVEQLSLNLDEKDEQITGLNATIEAKEQELTNKETELQEKDRMLEERDAKIKSLEEELGTNKNELEEAKRTIEAKDNEIGVLNRSLYAHQEYLVQLQNVLSVAQTGIAASVDQTEARKLR